MLEEEHETPMGEVDDIAKILESCVPCPDGSGANFTMIDSGTEIGQELLGYALCDLAREDSGRSQQMKEGEYVTTANGGQRKKPTECANCGVEQDDDVEIRACSKCKPERIAQSFVSILKPNLTLLPAR